MNSVFDGFAVRFCRFVQACLEFSELGCFSAVVQLGPDAMPFIRRLR